MAESKYQEIKFTDEDVVNAQDFGHYALGGVYLIHDHGFTVAVVIAGDEEEALDIAADRGKLSAFKVSVDVADESCFQCRGDGSFYDVGSLDIIQLPPIEVSVCALFNNSQSKESRPS